MFKVFRSKYIAISLVGCICVASIPNETVAFWNYFSRKPKKASIFNRGLLGIARKNPFLSLIVSMAAVACVWGVYNFIIKNVFSSDFGKRPGLDPSPTQNNGARQNKIKRKKKTNPSKIKKANNALSFDRWKALCARLPKYSDVRRDRRYRETVLTRQEFVRVFMEFGQVLRQSSFANNNNWVDLQAPLEPDFDFSVSSKNNQNNRNKFFVQKLDLPNNSEISMHADIHGDIHSVLEYIDDLIQRGLIDNNFRIRRQNFYVAFLGDYTDRGYYGAEVLYTIARLKIANPEQVILLRGNHEDIDINRRYGLISLGNWTFEPGELMLKFGLQEHYIQDLLIKFYNFMPSVVFVSSVTNSKDKKNNSRDYALLCHGGIEPRFNPHRLLSDNRPVLYQQLNNLNSNWMGNNFNQKIIKNGLLLQTKQGNLESTDVGFLWNDFTINSQDKGRVDLGRGNIFGMDLVQDYLHLCSSEQQRYRLRCIFRGHQHNGAMMGNMVRNHGIYNIWAPNQNQWDGKSGAIRLQNALPVWVMNVSPDTPYGGGEGYPFDTYSVLRLAGSYNNWTLHPRNVQVLDKSNS